MDAMRVVDMQLALLAIRSLDRGEIMMRLEEMIMISSLLIEHDLGANASRVC
jgi:hypothetical protein